MPVAGVYNQNWISHPTDLSLGLRDHGTESSQQADNLAVEKRLHLPCTYGETTQNRCRVTY